MLKVVQRCPVYLLLVVVLFVAVFTTTCIDPFTPHLQSYQKLLVVEGLVTDENTPCEVRLTRTYPSIDSIPEVIDDALVYLTDGEGNMINLGSTGNGIYRTGDSQFRGTPGSTYILHIQTPDGKQYESEPCVMTPVADIDSVHIARDEVVDNIYNRTLEGIRIFIDTGEPPEGTRYFRWEYDETWKFKLPYPQAYNYINDTTILKLDKIKEYCWRSNKSTDIEIASAGSSSGDAILNQPVLFISSDQSDRLSIEYSLLIRQFSLSEKEFDFWNNLKSVNESGGNIFDKQPYSVISNIYNIEDQNEKVLGYFRVSAVKTRRIFIVPNDLLGMDLPYFKYKCDEYSVSPETYVRPGSWSKPPTWDEIYEMFMHDGGFQFVKPIYNDTTEELVRVVFARKECSDCELNGTVTRPGFWVDIP
jgi:hypothetical protein